MIQDQTKPRMRSLLYLHLDDTTNGTRPPFIKQSPRHSRWLIVLLSLFAVYVASSLVLSYLGV